MATSRYPVPLEGVIAVTDSSDIIVPAYRNRYELEVTNNSSADWWMQWNQHAVLGQGKFLGAGDTRVFLIDPRDQPDEYQLAALYAIAATAGPHAGGYSDQGKS